MVRPSVAATCAYATGSSGPRASDWSPAFPRPWSRSASRASLPCSSRLVPPRAGAFALAAIAVLAVPAVASISVVANGSGRSTLPSRPARRLGPARAWGRRRADRALLPRARDAEHGQPDLMATQTAAVAAPFIYDSGREVVPIGGFTGTIPEPSLARLKAMIAAGDFHLVIQAPQVSDPRLVWGGGHCLPISTGRGRRARRAAVRRLLLRSAARSLSAGSATSKGRNPTGVWTCANYESWALRPPPRPELPDLVGLHGQALIRDLAGLDRS